MANNGKSGGWVMWIVLLLVVVLVGGGVAWHFLNKDDDGPQYQTATIDRGDIIQAVTATGTLNPVTNVTVGSQISGNIQHLYVDWNSPVKAGQIVAELDPSTYKAAVAQAEGDLASASATEELNQVEAKRADELFKSKLISESDHDTAIANLHQAQAMVKIKQATLDTAKVNLARCTIYSPVDGVVISRNVDVGQTVAASFSAPTLFIIANDLTKMEIDANVAEADVGGIQEKQDVNFTVDAFPNRTFDGKVIQVRYAPTNYQNVVSYDAVISVENRDMKLKPGMTANVSIIIAQKKDTLKIPNAALRFRPPETKEAAAKEMRTNEAVVAAAGTNAPGTNGLAGQTGTRPPGGWHGRGGGPGGRPHPEHQPVRTVYIQSDPKDPSKLTPVQVKVGISDGVYTEVVDGLKEGDKVVTGLSIPMDAEGGRPNNPFGGRGFRRF